jgi:hypothetical protein
MIKTFGYTLHPMVAGHQPIYVAIFAPVPGRESNFMKLRTFSQRVGKLQNVVFVTIGYNRVGNTTIDGNGTVHANPLFMIQQGSLQEDLPQIYANHRESTEE